jgi:uroporphyrin-3 C-methyltransferase
MAWLTGGLAVVALVGCALLWQKLDRIQEELAKRSLDTGAQSLEARGLARQAQNGTRELAARQTLLETRLSEVSLQRSQLEDLMQTLSRSRDETLVVDVESALKLAQQQAQLAGTAEPLLAALQVADQRIARAAQPRLNPLQRAIVRDLDRIRSANLTDVPALLLKLDELSRLTDELPLANGPVTKFVNPVKTPPAAVKRAANASVPGEFGSFLPDWMGLNAVNAWSQRLLNTVWDEASKLLRVSRIDQPDAALMSPEQGFFLRENLKLRLLNARMGLLSRQTDTARADLVTANSWLGKYFDATSRKTQTAAQLLQQVQLQLKTSDLPRLDETMAALATAAAGR